jgi:hypothetical protein
LNKEAIAKAAGKKLAKEADGKNKQLSSKLKNDTQGIADIEKDLKKKKAKKEGDSFGQFLSKSAAQKTGGLKQK